MSKKWIEYQLFWIIHSALLGLYSAQGTTTSVDISSVLKEILPEYPIISFRRPKSFKVILVRAKRRPKEHQVKDMFRYGKTRCQIYQFVRTGAAF